MSAWDKIDLATNWQPAPNFLYDEVRFLPKEFRKLIYHRIDQSFGYLLRNITVAYPTFIQERGTNYYANGQATDPEIEFYVRRQSRQSVPIPFRLITSPCDDGGSNDFMFPNINAAVLKSYVFLNYFFQFGDTIEMHIVRSPNYFDTVVTPPAYAYRMQTVLKGYDVPEPLSRVW